MPRLRLFIRVVFSCSFTCPSYDRIRLSQAGNRPRTEKTGGADPWYLRFFLKTARRLNIVFGRDSPDMPPRLWAGGVRVSERRPEARDHKAGIDRAVEDLASEVPDQGRKSGLRDRFSRETRTFSSRESRSSKRDPRDPVPNRAKKAADFE